jgi:3,4-dihydroxy 2-butanone 4-phosphate synthase/GTP cyclohydrolase II
MTTHAPLRLAPASTRVEAAIAAIANGEFVVVLDREDRENEGDLIMAAERVTPEAMAFMIRHTSGLVCVGMTGERLDELDIPLMVQHGTEAQGTAFTVSVDLLAGTTTGISAADRAATIRALVDPASAPGDFARPGHVFPLRARRGGVLSRPGHTEAAVDLAILAGLSPAGALCEIVRPDGGMARGEDLARFAADHGLAIITVDELIGHRRRREQLVLRRSSSSLPTPHGPFTVHAYESLLDGVEHLALVRGDVGGADPVFVRVHSECLTGDVFSSGRCDCGAQLELAMANIAEAGRGVVVYLRGHEGRGIGLAAKIDAYGLQDGGLDTVEANVALGLPVDDRDYGVGAQILDDLGVQAVRLMTNNPAKGQGLAGYGFDLTERVPLIVEPTADNGAYLSAKRRKLGHLLPQVSRSRWWDRTLLASPFFTLAD